MRIWSIHPNYLDWMGLGAQWREGLLAQKVLHGKTKGWRNHPQLDRFNYHSKPIEAVGFYLKELHVESLKRGYKYNYSKIIFPEAVVDLIDLSFGQLQYEFELLQGRLEVRSPEKYEENREIKELQSHTLFNVVPGLPEKWEKSYWVKKGKV